MSKKSSKQDEGMANYKLWLKEWKKLERMGWSGAEYYVKRVEDLEDTVKQLERKKTETEKPKKINTYIEQYDDRKKVFESNLLNKIEGFYSDLQWNLRLNPYINQFFNL